ncbi:MAG: homogentisate 1,2-dioxygenase [Saprospiraceae bacterium]|nr:MAG: homogentisate 1,2-dioxygenase [Bacteroidetes bacterium OLB9]MCO6463082.1 homogentisate 1,2-dioxygenase [Saprospiraceae bacterium]
MHYYSLGKIPPKRHTQFRKSDGSLYNEQVFSTEGFSNLYSILYHNNPPTMVTQVGDPVDVTPKTINDRQLKPRSLSGFNIPQEDDFLESRKVVLTNDECQIALAAPRKSMTDYFYKNGDSDEVIFIHIGSGTLKTMYGNLPFEYGDYLVIPRGTIYQLEFDTEDNRLLIVESNSPIITPKRYRNDFGQLMEHSPFCERDIRKPHMLVTYDEKGDFLVQVKKQNNLYPFHYKAHPFDVVGWDGYLYPYAFSIFNFEPITGRIHLPPPIHQTFESRSMVICSFVPRMYDYHPLAIPAPYHHSNIDSEEVLYYVDGEFMSRKHVDKGQITLHPGGLAHGPHPGAMERSIGQKETKEMAVMIDAFKPLLLTDYGMEIEDEDYYLSWLP